MSLANFLIATTDALSCSPVDKVISNRDDTEVIVQVKLLLFPATMMVWKEQHCRCNMKI